MKYICTLLVFFLIGCGSATLGPLVTKGLDARIALQSTVQQRQRHGTSNNAPLDALLEIDHQAPMPTGTPITGWTVAEEGLVTTPTMIINDRPLVRWSDGTFKRMIPVVGPLLTLKISWPDTTITLVDTVLTDQELTSDTITHTTAWSKAASSSIQTFGPRADSLVLDILFFADSLNSAGDTSFVVPDTGSFTLPPSIITAIQPGNQVIVQVGRSHYRVHSLHTPTSGYGDRVVGILQKRFTTMYHLVITP